MWDIFQQRDGRDWVSLSQSRKLPSRTEFHLMSFWGMRIKNRGFLGDCSRNWKIRIPGLLLQPLIAWAHLNLLLIFLLIWWPWEILFVCVFKKDLRTWMSMWKLKSTPHGIWKESGLRHGEGVEWASKISVLFLIALIFECDLLFKYDLATCLFIYLLITHNNSWVPILFRRL